jgi:hypothetical protein
VPLVARLPNDAPSSGLGAEWDDRDVYAAYPGEDRPARNLSAFPLCGSVSLRELLSLYAAQYHVFGLEGAGVG